MKIIRDINNCKFSNKIVIALGNFDGLHMAHKHLIKESLFCAKENNMKAVVFTFHPHPIKILHNVSKPFLIQRFKNKAYMMSKLGVEVLIVVRFSKEFASIEPEDFAERILVQTLNVGCVFVGYDYTFGKNGKGSVGLLRAYAKKYDFVVKVLPPFKIDGVIVSSSKIRYLLKAGDIKQANRFLGYNYNILGIVKRGKGRGKIIGFPTANIYPKDDIFLKNGVYAAYAYIDNSRFKAAVNVGSNPTFKDKYVHIEAYLLNFDKNIYNKRIKIEFIDFIRDEITFDNVGSLVQTIKKDVIKIGSVLR